jgi:hypothetical protein
MVMPKDYYTDDLGIFKEDYHPHSRVHLFLHHISMALFAGLCSALLLVVFGLFPIAGYSTATPFTHFMNRFWFALSTLLAGFIIPGNAQPTGINEATLVFALYFALPFGLITIVVPIVNGSADAGEDDAALSLNVAGFSRIMAVPLFFVTAWVWARRQLLRPDWKSLHRMCAEPDKGKIFRRSCRNVLALIFSLFPIYYLQYDISLITSGKLFPADSPILMARPIISLFIKKLSWGIMGYVVTNMSEDLDHEEQKQAMVYAPPAIFFSLGMHTAFKIAQSRTLNQVISYGVVDALVVGWKMWVFHGLDTEPKWTDLPNALRSVYLIPNPAPPYKTNLQTWTGYIIVGEGLGLLSALFCLLFLYPLASLLDDDAVVKCFFPLGQDSFVRLLGMTAFFCVMETEVCKQVVTRLNCNFAKAFDRPDLILRSLLATCFCPALLVNYAFLFKQTEVGPWLEA